MEKLKKRWEITKNWQLIHVLIGLIATFFLAFLLARLFVSSFLSEVSTYYNFVLLGVAILIAYTLIKITLWLFSRLYKRWGVEYRWELIAIFLVFALTGSTAGKLSNPIMEMIGLDKNIVSGWIYWPVRILMIFPIYQVLLVFIGWIFGQYSFFKNFAVKMVSRLGLGFLFPS